MESLFVHSESIAALGGGQVEAAIISKRFDANMEVQREVWWRGLRLTASYQIAFVQGIGFFLKVAGLAPGVFNVPDNVEAQAIAMAETQFRMSNMIQMSIGIAMAMVSQREIQQQSGPAGRVMGMIDALGKMSDKRKCQTSTTFKSGQYIEFSDVDIETPTKVCTTVCPQVFALN